MIAGFRSGKNKYTRHNCFPGDPEEFLAQSLKDNCRWLWAENPEDFELLAAEFARQINGKKKPHMGLLRWASHALSKIADGKEKHWVAAKSKLVAKPAGRGRPVDQHRDLNLISVIELERQVHGRTVDDAVREALEYGNFKGSGLNFESAKQVYKRKRKLYQVTWDKN